MLLKKVSLNMRKWRRLCVIPKDIATFSRSYSAKSKAKLENHPYCNIHPWKSQRDLSKFLYDNIIYEHDGLVVINKPYGIALYPTPEDNVRPTKNKIFNSVPFTILESLDYLAEKLNYSQLQIIKSPEKYMSGVTLLCGTENSLKRAKKSLHSKIYKDVSPATYWILTTKLPKEISGQKRLGITQIKYKHDPKLTAPALVTEWTKNSVKRGEVIPIVVTFKLLSNSKDNLASLIELNLTKRKKHAIRLFAASMLNSPILGDNIYGYMVQKVLGYYTNVGPFSHLRDTLPQLDGQLLRVLDVPKQQQEIIPVHTHLRQLKLFRYLKEEDLTFEAPLMPEFQYSCDRLKFKYLTPEEEKPENEESVEAEKQLHDHLEKFECRE